MTDTDDTRPTLLIVEDNPGDARLIREMLRDVELDWGPFTGDRTAAVEVAESLSGGIDAIDGTTELVLLDLELPDSKGLETVDRMAGAFERGAIVVLTGLDDEATGMEAIERGAQDYLVKDDVDPRTLRRSIRYALERDRRQRELRRRNEQLGVLTWILRNHIRDEMAIVVGRGRSLDDHVDPAGREYLEEVIAAGENVTELSESVGRYLSALEDGDAAADAVPLEPTVTGALSSVRGANPAVTYEVVGQVPDVAVAGSELIGSAVGELLELATPADPEDGPVEVAARTAGERAVVEIRRAGALEAGSHGTETVGGGAGDGPARGESREEADGGDPGGEVAAIGAENVPDQGGPSVVDAVIGMSGGDLSVQGGGGTIRVTLPLR